MDGFPMLKVIILLDLTCTRLNAQEAYINLCIL